MLKRISISTVLFLVISTNLLIAQHELTITVGDTTIVYSRLNSFNAYANTVGLDVLSESEYSNITHLRLWGPLSHSFATRLLDVSVESDQIVGKWYATWVNNSRQRSEKALIEKWKCISEIQTISSDFGSRSGCLIAEADTDGIRRIRDLVYETDFLDLLHQPLEKRVQIDGKSLHVEILNQEGHRFVSFMNYHIENHPQKELIEKARTVLSLWQNNSTQ
jgi:hypothetical protein